jgi:hypothetical protein
VPFGVTDRPLNISFIPVFLERGARFECKRAVRPLAYSEAGPGFKLMMNELEMLLTTSSRDGVHVFSLANMGLGASSTLYVA